MMVTAAAVAVRGWQGGTLPHSAGTPGGPERGSDPASGSDPAPASAPPQPCFRRSSLEKGRGIPVVRTPCLRCRGCVFNPCLGNEDPENYMAWPN